MSRLHKTHSCLLVGFAGALVGTTAFMTPVSAQAPATQNTFQVHDPGVRGGPAGAGNEK